MKILKTTSILLVSLVILAFTSNLNPEKTISEMVSEKQDLSTLLTALEAAGLVETLKGEGPFTVFAPTNEAFNNLPEGKLDDLLKPENKEKLAGILKYHVISGKVYASDLSEEQMVATIEGNEVRIQAISSMDEMSGGESEYTKVKINNAKVIESDIEASNGVIHIINGVVMPSDIEVMGSKEIDY
jgi:uncharacterized surface protein with fasciclin (FAS1) repeats